MQTSDESIRAMAVDWTASSGVGSGVFGFGERTLLPGAENSFCVNLCPLGSDSRCDPQVAHRFGCYEAERWDGQYIYYCPASLVFVATLIYARNLPNHGLVAGPLVMGDVDDLLSDLEPDLCSLLGDLPERSPAEVNAMARVQQVLCAALSTSPRPEPVSDQVEVDFPKPVSPADDQNDYPLDVEKKLVAMIRHGDRAGAAELINHLLAALYLANGGDLPRLRQGATDLVTLFSRAAIDGGADPRVIFGEKRALDRRISALRTLDELSRFLVSVFNRFVGYVFDFSQFQHANVLRQAVSFIRTHYAERITLADAAHHVWMSPNYLSSVFSVELGISFTTYVQSVRIEKSKDLLTNSRKSIAEIAAHSGFSDQSYFTKVFTKAVGVSPSQFRRQEGGETP